MQSVVCNINTMHCAQKLLLKCKNKGYIKRVIYVRKQISTLLSAQTKNIKKIFPEKCCTL